MRKANAACPFQASVTPLSTLLTFATLCKAKRIPSVLLKEWVCLTRNSHNLSWDVARQPRGCSVVHFGFSYFKPKAFRKWKHHLTSCETQCQCQLSWMEQGAHQGFHFCSQTQHFSQHFTLRGNALPQHFTLPHLSTGCCNPQPCKKQLLLRFSAAVYDFPPL